MPSAFPTVSLIKVRSRALAGGSPAQDPIYAGRLYSRRTIDVRARLTTPRVLNGRIKEVVVHGRTIDLSRSGIGLMLTRELPAGVEVALSVQLPGIDGPLFLRAVVVRRRGFRAGLKFVQPTAEQRLQLCQFCYS